MKIREIDLKRLINPKKLKMIQIVGRNPKINQLELSKKMKLSVRQTRRYIDNLANAKIISKSKPHVNVRGKPRDLTLRKIYIM